nr:oligosaccharide flippase family protein [Afifella sp. IM 167]
MLEGEGDFLGNAGIAFAIRMSGAGIGFALQVLLARLLPLDDYGLYVTFWTWLILAGQIAALGFNDSVIRFLPRYLERSRLDDAHGYLTTGFFFVVFGSAAIATIGLALIWALPSIYPDGDPRWMLLTLFFIGIPFMAVELYLDGIARSVGLFVLSAAPAFIVRPVLLASSVALLALLGFEVEAALALAAAIAVTGAVTIGQAIMLRARIRRQFTGTQTRPTAPQKKRRLWLAATLPLTLVYGVEEIYLVSDILLLGLLGDPGQVGIYFTAVRLMALAGYVYYAFMLISSREFSLARARRDPQELQASVTKATRWTFWLTVPTVCGLVALGYPLLSIFGPAYTAGYGVLAVLALGLLARASVGQAGDLLVVLGYQKTTLVVAVGSLLLNAIVTLALLPSLGIMAAAIGTVASQAGRAAALAYLAQRHAGVATFVLAARRTPKLPGTARPS